MKAMGVRFTALQVVIHMGRGEGTGAGVPQHPQELGTKLMVLNILKMSEIMMRNTDMAQEDTKSTPELMMITIQE